MPRGRTADYAIWSACERFKILPPGVRPSWDDNDADSQAMLISYSQIRAYEEASIGHAEN